MVEEVVEFVEQLSPWLETVQVVVMVEEEEVVVLQNALLVMVVMEEEVHDV